MDKEKQTNNSGLSSGFLLGVVVGVIITLLMTTKRGKRIVKMITEEGMHKLSDFEDVFSDMIDEYENKPVDPKQTPVAFIETIDEIDDEDVQSVVHPLQKTKSKKTENKVVSSKRFFKGIHRRSVN